MTGSGTVVVCIPEGAARAGAGSLNTASTSDDNGVNYIVNGTPTFELTGPDSGTYAPGQPITITWTADNISGDKVISLCIDKDAKLWNRNEQWIEVDLVAAANCNDSYTINPDNFPPGTYYIGGYMYDKTLRTFTESHVTAPITIPAPSFALTGPSRAHTRPASRLLSLGRPTICPATK